MNLATATMQELFDAAVRGLASQEWRQASNADGDCLLRAPDGFKCAVGWCIDDADYSPAMEALGPKDILHRYYDGKFAGHASILWEMQSAHDDCGDPEQMFESFINLAANFNLTWPADVELPQ